MTIPAHRVILPWLDEIAEASLTSYGRLLTAGKVRDRRVDAGAVARASTTMRCRERKGCQVMDHSVVGKRMRSLASHSVRAAPWCEPPYDQGHWKQQRANAPNCANLMPVSESWLPWQSCR